MSYVIPIHADETVGITSVVQLQPEQLSDESNGTFYGTITLVSARSRQEQKQQEIQLKQKPKNPLQTYMNLLQTNPLTTKMITVGTVSSLSDMTAQLLQGTSVSSLDVYRSFTMFMVGCFLTAPMYHVLYARLEKKFPLASRYINRYIHLAVDQLIAIPVWTLLFFVFLAVLRGHHDVLLVVRYIGDHFLTVVLTSWIIYPFLQYLNFSFVPGDARVLVLTAISFFFTVIVTLLTSSSTTSASEAEQVAKFFIKPFT